MSIQVLHKKPTPEEYVDLRIKTGMGEKDLNRSRIALENSLLIVSVYDNDQLIGFGRIVGDQGLTYVVSDIMVDPAYQRRGYAGRIMQEIDRYFDEFSHEDSFIFLIANKPADRLYSKHRFEYLSNNRCGMLRNQR